MFFNYIVLDKRTRHVMNRHVMNRQKWLMALVCGFLLVVTACAGNEPTAPAAPPSEVPSEPASAQEVLQATLNIAMHDIYFGDDPNNIENPPQWKVKSGELVTLNLDNQGALEHNWIIAKQGENVPLPYLEDQHKSVVEWASDKVAADSKASIDFSAPAPGTYLVFCGVAGHFPVMQGTLLVE